MEEVIGSQSNLDSSSYASLNRSSKASTSSKSSEDRPKKRPCLIWRIFPNVQVLVMSKFDEIDVTDQSIRFFDHLPRQYILKRLLGVHPKQSFEQRRSVMAARIPADGRPIRTTNTYLILIPVIVQDMAKLKHAEEYFPQQELKYIHEILLQIAKEEAEDQSRTIDATNPPLMSNVHVESQSDSMTSSSSSLPKPRTNFVEFHNTWNKNDLVKQWLNNRKKQ